MTWQKQARANEELPQAPRCTTAILHNLKGGWPGVVISTQMTLDLIQAHTTDYVI